jgi:hypothetical protein
MGKQKKNDALELNCRVCQEFELMRVLQPNFAPTRKMGVCHALEVVLSPKFPDEIIAESFVISKANERTVQFEIPDNCPKLQKLREQGLAPWASSVIDFSTKNSHNGE